MYQWVGILCGNPLFSGGSLPTLRPPFGARVPNPTRTEELLHACSRFLENEGVPPLGGRIFGVLLLSGQTLTLDDLSARSAASKASASSNSRMLERMGLVERLSLPGDRRDHYRIASGGVAAPLALVLSRLTALTELYRLLAAADGPAPPEVRNRLRLDITFIDHLLQTFEALSREWGERTRGPSA